MSLTQRAKMEILRTSIQKVTRLLTKSKLPVILAGSQARVEYHKNTGKPVAVYLPSLPDNASEELIDAIQGFVDHEVAHVLFSDFDVLLEGIRMNIPMLLNAAEDTFIERKIMSVYEGTKHNVAKMRDLFLDKFIDPVVQKAYADGLTDPKQWWGILGVCAMRAWAGHVEFEIYMDDKWPLLGSIPVDAETKKVPEQLKAIECTADSLKAAIRISHIVQEARKMSEKEKEEEKAKSKSGGKDKGKGKSEKSSGKGGKKDPSEAKEPDADEDKGEPEKSDKPGDDDEDAGGGAGDDEGDDESEEDGAAPGDPSLSGDEDEDEDEGESGGDPAEATPSEPATGFRDQDMKGVEDFLGDVISEEAKRATDASTYLPYTRDADRIIPLTDDKVDGTAIEDMENQIKSAIAPVQRALANAFESRNRTFQVHGRRQGRLSGPSLHRLVTNDDRVYYETKEARTRDSAVQLVVDISGSMRGHKVRLAAQVAWALTEVLDRLKVKSEVICFTQVSKGTLPPLGHNPYEKQAEEVKKHGYDHYTRMNPIYMPILKSWDEPNFTPMHKRHFTRMGNSELPMHGNVDGESLQYAGLRLHNQREPGKIMIVLSDGQPAGDGDHSKFSAHLKEVVRDLTKSGINVIGIGITDSSVKHYYPKHVVVNDMKDLAGTVMAKVREALLAS